MLREKADRRTLAFVATYFGLVAAAWTVEPTGWARAGFVVAICSFAWFCAVITHNTIHTPVFKQRWLNKLFQVVLTQTYGHPVSTFVPGHNLSHHRFTQGPRDVMRTTKMRFRWNLLNGLFFFFGVLPAIVKGERAYIAAMKDDKPRWYRQFLLEAVVLYGGMIALAVLDWRKFLLYWYLPHVWASWGIVTINLLQHDGCDADHPYNHSRNFTGRFFGWWTFNNGFHGIHHLEPSLHWSKCRAAHDEKVKPHLHPNLDQPSIAAYIWRTYVWPGTRVDFEGKPWVLPPKVKDENWVPARGQVVPDVSLGAEA